MKNSPEMTVKVNLYHFRYLLVFTCVHGLASVLVFQIIYLQNFNKKNKRMLSLLWKNITSLLWHYWFGRHEGHLACKSLVLVCRWWWFDWSFARLIAPVVITTSIVLSSIKSRMETSWYRLNPGSPGKCPLKQTDRWCGNVKFSCHLIKSSCQREAIGPVLEMNFFSFNWPLFRRLLQVSPRSPKSFKGEPLVIGEAGFFYSPHAISVTQPIVSKH